MRHQFFVGLTGFFIVTAMTGGPVVSEWPGLQLSPTMTMTAPTSAVDLLRQAAAALVISLPFLTVGPPQVEAATAAAAATPTSIPVSQPTEVTVTTQLTDPRMIPESVNLQRVDATGRVIAILGPLNDQGIDGDAVPGDQVFTIRYPFTEASATSILLRVSWAIQGGLGRAMSNTLSVTVR